MPRSQPGTARGPGVLLHGLPGHPIQPPLTDATIGMFVFATGLAVVGAAGAIRGVLTAGGGFVMLGLWLKHGGMASSEAPGDRIRSGRILSHFALAATGLVIWIVYLASDRDALAWVAFALLVVVALLGFSMLAIWLRQRARVPVAATTPVQPDAPPERHFPVPIVGAHGILAATTLVLVLLVAAGVGD